MTVKTAGSKLQLKVDWTTQKGSRGTNEDSSLVLTGEDAPCGTLGLLVVADGIGGRGTGGAASDMAVRTVADVFAAGCSIASGTLSDVPHLLRFAVQKANAAVFHAQLVDESLSEMGTTCVAAAVTDQEVHLVSIGDSRAYLLHRGELTALTTDEWVKRPDGVTIVNRAVGLQPVLPTEPSSFAVSEGDVILLCTDGLTDFVTEDFIRSTLVNSSPSEACNVLADRATSQPGADNVAIIVAKLVRQ